MQVFFTKKQNYVKYICIRVYQNYDIIELGGDRMSNNNRVFSNNNNKPWTEEELKEKIEKIDLNLIANIIKDAGIDYSEANVNLGVKKTRDGEIFLTLEGIFIKPDKNNAGVNLRFKL
jgi:hypothetical protein